MPVLAPIPTHRKQVHSLTFNF
uniref:Uncharacterized protein n=1 Tax=Rhizophora mucronata TaxID=61149 RepID=A0A2P2PS95_RHIMU